MPTYYKQTIGTTLKRSYKRLIAVLLLSLINNLSVFI